MRFPLLLLAALLGLPLSAARAQSALHPSLVEVTTAAERLSGPYADGHALHLRLALAGRSSTWRANWSLQDRFGAAGVVLGAGYARELGGAFFASTYAGTSAGSPFEHRLRAGVDAGRRWGPRQALVTTAGAWLYAAPDGHRDAAATAEAAFYAPRGIVLQAGARLTRSAPGAVWSPYAHAAVTLASPSGRLLALRAAGGREGYQLAAPMPLRVGFSSWEAQATWRQPLGQKVGLHVRAGYYHNPYYARTSVEAGVFHQF